MNGTMQHTTINPPDAATLIYHDALRRASEAVSAYSAAAHAKIDADEAVSAHQHSVEYLRADVAATIEGKNEAARAAALLLALDGHDAYVQGEILLASARRRAAEMRVAMELAQMEHSTAKRQLDFAAASVRGLS